MKTLATLTATAILAAGFAAHAGEPLRLDESSLDRVTAGNLTWQAFAFTGQIRGDIFPLGNSLAGGSVVLQGTSSASGERTFKVTASGPVETVNMRALSTSRSVATTSGANVAIASGSGGVGLTLVKTGNN